MARRRSSSVTRVRRVLLVLMVLLTAALVGLYLFGRAGRPLPTEIPVTDDDGEIPSGEITLIGEGFEFTHSEGERPVFRIRGESVRADRAGTVYLDQVGLTLYDEEGTGYDVEAERASFNRDTRLARLAGEVVLSGPDNMRLRTRGLRLVEQGRVLVSTGPVRFTFQQLTGRADVLRIDRDQDLYRLAGEVRVESLPEAETPFSLAATRLTFDQPRHQVQAEGSVVVTRGEDRVEANRINAFLDDEDEVVLFLRARFDVTGRLTVTPTDGTAGEDGAAEDEEAAGRPLRFEARSLALLRDVDGQLRNAEMEGSPLEPVVLESPSDDGTLQRLVAGYLVGDFQGGALSAARAFNEPRVLELPAGGGSEEDALRYLEGRRLEAAFAGDGRLVTVRAEEEVFYRDEQVEARGAEGELDVLQEKGLFTGDPVRMVSERGELLAPRVNYDRNVGILHAEGGVRALAREAESIGLQGTPLAEGEGPVRVESEEAFWRDDPRSAMFRGEVRAWRDENLLLADVVRVDQEDPRTHRLVASGGVRTVWIPAPADADALAGDGDAPRAPVEVTANTLTYQKPREVLIYEGRVQAEEGRQDLSCQRLEVELNDQGEAETLTCIGQVTLDDRAAGNSAQGERAVYDLASRTVTMTGDPVTLQKSDGAQVQGGRVVYDLTTGKARVVGEGGGTAAPASAPTTPGGGETGEPAPGPPGAGNETP